MSYQVAQFPEGTANRVASVDFVDSTSGAAADMSATRLVTPWLFSDQPIVRARYDWTGTGSPAGAFGMEFSIGEMAAGVHRAPVLADEGDVYPLTQVYPTPNQPAGDGNAGRCAICVPQAGLWYRGTYTRTSGGTGATATALFAVMG